MLVLLCKSVNNFRNSEKNHFPRKIFFGKYEKPKASEFDRYSLTVNGKRCYVISAEKEFYLSGNIAGLLNAFSGSVLASEMLYDVPYVSDNLLDIMPYYKKYAAVYFADSLKTLCPSSGVVAFYDRGGEYIQYMKSAFSFLKAFEFYTDSPYDYSGMIKRCFNEYGFKPRFFNFNESCRADVSADIDSVSPGGLLKVRVFNNTRIISASYPRYKFNAEAMHLLQSGINRDYITAAFYDVDL